METFASITHYSLFHLHPNPLTMATKFRRIHTLNAGNAIAEIAGIGNKQRVFEHMGSFGQPAEKETGAGIACGFVIAQSALPFVLT